MPRWMAFLGMFTALLIFLPIGGAELQVVPAFWMVMIGVLFFGRWPNGEPASVGSRRGEAMAVAGAAAGTTRGRPRRDAAYGRRGRGARAGAAVRRRLLAQAPAQARCARLTTRRVRECATGSPEHEQEEWERCQPNPILR